MKTRFSRSRGKEAGMALVVCLALIVLITAAVLAFFARATANRVVEASRANRVEVEQLTKSAGDYIISGFLREISVNSAGATNSGVVIFQPTNNTFAIPQRPLPTAIASDASFANLIRRSVNESTNGVGETNASEHGTGAASRNGRTVGAASWNAPMLLSGGGFTSTNQLPNWIYVNEDGSVTGVSSTDAVGRFAYNVYDAGGLLDANVAGYPSGLSGTNLAILKGTIAGADLSQIPGITDPEAFVVWRNTNSAGSPSAYVSAVTNAATNGFLRSPSGDNRVTSRQDLIRLAMRGSHGISTNALPFLTHFTRELDAPSWMPATNGTGASYQYLDASDAASSVNRNIPNVRVVSPFTRRDGRMAKTGEPLIKNRFPLTRLTGIGASGPTGPATAASIQRDFGLVWQNDRWEYCGPGGNAVQGTILRLDQVAAQNREPNFFELLKAGILSGSLAQGGASQGTFWNRSDPNKSNPYNSLDLYPDFHTIQIGANLIDQFDANDIPTTIAFTPSGFTGASPYANPQVAIGIENLPYIYKFLFTAYRTPATPGVPNPLLVRLDVWANFVLWNPHQNPTATAHQLRIVQTAISQSMGINNGANGSGTPAVPSAAPPITFNNSAAFADAALPLATFPDAGMKIASAAAPDSRIPGTTGLPGLNTYNQIRFYGSGGTGTGSYELQIFDGTRWIPYQLLRNTGAYSASSYPGDNPGALNAFRDPNAVLLALRRPDPRGTRFGGSAENHDANYPVAGNGWLTSGANFGISEHRPSGSMFTPNTGGGWMNPGIEFYRYAENKPASSARYSDPDGIIRRGDADLGAGFDPYPVTGAVAQVNRDVRPIVLNRPFFSVGEMGYACRDLPWKTIDFFSATSADEGLLDLFCVSENDVGLRGGVLNLNTRNPAVLSALLTGAIKNQAGAFTLGTANALSISSDITASTALSPWANKAELAAFVSTNSVLKGIKTQRETIVRALADAGQTRTWGFLIDIIAQSGRFSGGAVTAGQFNVEAQQRTWVSVAIDRPTATVIDRQVEEVSE